MSEGTQVSQPASAVAVSTPVAPVAASATPVKLTAIQIIEQEIGNFIKQREQAVANIHAVEGAIQAGQHLLAKLRAEAAKAEAEVKKVSVEVVDAVKKEL